MFKDLKIPNVFGERDLLPPPRDPHHHLPRCVPFRHPLELTGQSKDNERFKAVVTSSLWSCSHNTQSAGYPPDNLLFSPTWIWTRLIEVREASLERSGRWSVRPRDQRDTGCSSEAPKIPKSSMVCRDGNAVSDRRASKNSIGYHRGYLSMQ